MRRQIPLQKLSKETNRDYSRYSDDVPLGERNLPASHECWGRVTSTGETTSLLSDSAIMERKRQRKSNE